MMSVREPPKVGKGAVPQLDSGVGNLDPAPLDYVYNIHSSTDARSNVLKPECPGRSTDSVSENVSVLFEAHQTSESASYCAALCRINRKTVDLQACNTMCLFAACDLTWGAALLTGVFQAGPCSRSLASQGPGENGKMAPLPPDGPTTCLAGRSLQPITSGFLGPLQICPPLRHGPGITAKGKRNFWSGIRCIWCAARAHTSAAVGRETICGLCKLLLRNLEVQRQTSLEPHVRPVESRSPPHKTRTSIEYANPFYSLSSPVIGLATELTKKSPNSSSGSNGCYWNS